MKHGSLALLFTTTLLTTVACTPAPADELQRSPASDDPNGTASGESDNTFNHTKESAGTGNGVTDIHARQIDESQAGTPIEVAKMHGAQKLGYAALGALLSDLGVSLVATATAPTPGPTQPGNDKGGGGAPVSPTLVTAGDLYTFGKSSLGAPVYASRTPEMIVPSTSSLAKEFDIFVAAAPQIIAGISGSRRCPGVMLVQADQLTADGISCLIGRPASADHVTLANKLVAEAGGATTGLPIAIATLLASAHISE